MERKYNFNVEMARENVKVHEEYLQKAREEQAQKTVNNFLISIDRESQKGEKSIPLQSSHTDTINSIIKKDLEELGFQVEKKGQVFKISWL